MDPLYDGRVTLHVGDTARGTWGLPKGDWVGVGRLPGMGVHVPDPWVPSRLCRFLPYELGWLVQLGRARARVHTKYLGDMNFPPRSVVALQPGQSQISFPELDDHCMLGVTIGAREADGYPVAIDDRTAREEARRTAYGAASALLPEHYRRVLAVTYQHLLSGQPAPANVAATAAARLGMSEQAVKNLIGKAKKLVNRERWLDLQTTEQLGYYLVHLSRNLTWNDLPPELRDS